VVDFAVEHPERVLSLVPVDAPLDGVEWLTNFGTRVGIAARLANQIGMDSALDLWLEDELLAPAMNNSDCAAALEEIIRDYTGWHWTSGAKSLSRDTHTSELLNTIVSPTLVIVGEHDLIDFHAMGDVMAEGIDGAHKVVIPNIGHMSNMEDPVAFNALLHGFLSGIE
jgi:pimeloyl-ACP methyl ester carboxylesterase